MGTVHNNKGELHGMTVVVDTQGPQVYIGRCATMDDQVVIPRSEVTSVRRLGEFPVE